MQPTTHSTASTGSATKPSVSPSSVPTNVTVNIVLNSDGELDVSIPNPEFQDPGHPRDLALTKGSWEIQFVVDPTTNLKFDTGPILVGKEAPPATIKNPVLFSFTCPTATTSTMTFDFVAAAEGDVFRYVLRLVDTVSGTKYLIDPKVINRGSPIPGDSVQAPRPVPELLD